MMPEQEVGEFDFVVEIDLVGEKDRGFAMGLNEFAGYLAVAIVAFFTGWIASEYGLRPYPFYIGIVLIILGLVFSIFFISGYFTPISLKAKSTFAFVKSKFMWFPKLPGHFH